MSVSKARRAELEAELLKTMDRQDALKAELREDPTPVNRERDLVEETNARRKRRFGDPKDTGAAGTCSLCGRAGATLQAGGDVGLCHPVCFQAFDRQAEAEERLQVDLRASWPVTFQAPPRRRRARSRVRPAMEAPRG